MNHANIISRLRPLPHDTGTYAKMVVLVILATSVFAPMYAQPPQTDIEQVVSWQGLPERAWPGPQIWANRLQDWSVTGGKLRCLYQPGGKSLRTAHLLSHAIQDRGERFSVELEMHPAEAGQAGLLLAAGEGGLSYKQASLVQTVPGRGGGFLVALDFTESTLSIRDFGTTQESYYPDAVADHRVTRPLVEALPDRFTLAVHGERSGEDFVLTAKIIAAGSVLAESTATVPASRVAGNIAITSRGSQGFVGHTFSGLSAGGDRVAHYPERVFGPIAGVLYSVANGDLKVGVQCVSLGQTLTPNSKQLPGRRLAVRLERRDDQGNWNPATPPAGISEPDYYALLRVRGYDSSKPQSFRVVMNGKGDTQTNFTFDVPAEPKADAVIAGVSCTGFLGRKFPGNAKRLAQGERYTGRWTPANVWAPFDGVTSPLLQRDPDIVFFTGDQLYEGNPTPRDPVDAFPAEDYLYKWLIWHWSFQDVTRSRPCILQTDDHDVWHPNLWGDGGRLMTQGWDSGGGFIMSPYFVNMVQRTMCGHNPDAFDPGPLDSGVTNYFTTFKYGGVDFALLEDRKFKSASREASRQVSPPELLGDTQMQMLEGWAGATDPSPARIVVSQSVYAKISTHSKTGKIGTDRDTHGWPKEARDRAVELFERSGAVLFTGDQHLASVIRLETTDGPGVIQFAQPASGCIWWRWFYPNVDEPKDTPNSPTYTGRFTDGFDNSFEVYAVANPGPEEMMRRLSNPPRHVVSAEEASAGIGHELRLHQAEGFALIRIDSRSQKFIFECWPYGTSFSADSAPSQFKGWPIEFPLALFGNSARR